MRALEFNINAIIESTQRQTNTKLVHPRMQMLWAPQNRKYFQEKKKRWKNCIYARRQEFCQLIAVGIGT